MKAKFNKLDKSKLSKEVNAILDKIKKATDNFKKEDKKAEALFDRLYDKIAKGKPEAIKSTKKPSVKKKKASGGNRGVFTKLAKSIRDDKPSMTWKQAMSEASKQLKKGKDEENKKFTDSIQTLMMKNKAYFGSSSASSLLKDAKQPAKPIGARISKKSGKKYYEYRTNRTDVKQPPKSFPMLEKGGDVNRGSFNVEITLKDGRGADILPIDVSKKDAQDIADMINNMKPMSAKADVSLPFAKGGIPKGYHKMPNGEIMKNSDHLAKGGLMDADTPLDYAKGGSIKVGDKVKYPKAKISGKVKSIKDLGLERELTIEYDDGKIIKEGESSVIKFAKGGKVILNKRQKETLVRLKNDLKESQKYLESIPKSIDDEEQLSEEYSGNIYTSGFNTKDQLKDIIQQLKDDINNLENNTMAKGGKVRSKKVLQSIIDEVEKEGKRPSTAYYNAKAELDSPKMAKGGKTQGYNSRLDESLGNRKGKESTKQQSKKDRRDESKGMEKGSGRRAYSSVSTMDVGDRMMAKGGDIDFSDKKNYRNTSGKPNWDKISENDLKKGYKKLDNDFRDRVSYKEFKEIFIEQNVEVYAKGGKTEVTYTEDELKYALGVDDDYENWVELAFQRGYKYDESKDEWYLPYDYAKGGNVPKRFLDEKGERKNDPETIKELTKYVMSLPQTKKSHYNNTTEKYSPKRQKLHREIINKFKGDLVCIESDEPIAILMGGSPASGKSTFLKKYAPYLLKEELLRIDADEVRAMLPEYKGWNASATHNETQDIVKTLLSDRTIGVPCKYDLIFDGTMTSPKKYLDLIKLLKKIGYKVFVVFIDKVPKDVIMKRAMDRYKKSGRFVPPFVIEEFFESGKDSLAKVKSKVDGYMIVDGSDSNYKISEQKGLKLPKTRKYGRLGVPLKKSIKRKK